MLNYKSFMGGVKNNLQNSNLLILIGVLISSASFSQNSYNICFGKSINEQLK